MLGEFHGHRGLVGYTSWGYKESDEIKRHLLLGRKAMTNPDSIFKSRDVTLPTKVHLVKAMVFPVVMYGFTYRFGLYYTYIELNYKES